jgi:hypothetical protein
LSLDLIIDRHSLQSEFIDRPVQFTECNSCDECYVSIRSYLDKTFPQLLRENVDRVFLLQIPSAVKFGTVTTFCPLNTY